MKSTEFLFYGIGNCCNVVVCQQAQAVPFFMHCQKYTFQAVLLSLPKLLYSVLRILNIIDKDLPKYHLYLVLISKIGLIFHDNIKNIRVNTRKIRFPNMIHKCFFYIPTAFCIYMLNIHFVFV